MRTRLSLDFTKMKDADLLVKSGHIISSLNNNAHYPRPWPQPTPSFEELTTAHQNFLNAVQAAQTHDSLKISEREKVREQLLTVLFDLAPYLELVAKGDENILKTTGYDLTHPRASTPATGEPLGKILDFSVIRSDMEGMLIAHATKLQGARSYEVQIAEGDPTVEGNWHQYSIFASDRRMEIKGLTPGHKVSVRTRGIGIPGPGPWSETISLMVA